MHTTRHTLRNLLNRAGHPRRPAHAPRAFTMIEALVAIGAMALVAVGIAAIFQSVGKTVSGGRRLSVLNGYAAMIEQQMRREFEHMTRDGFMVVRNQYADVDANRQFTVAADKVSISPTDPAPRPRRIDEIMFIAKGEYTSVREPFDAAYVARSQFARIYFGHGLRLPASAPLNAYARPETNHTGIPAPRFGRNGAGGATGVNQFAKDWTLLRHATLLVRPETTQSSLPSNQVFTWKPTGPTQSTLRDKEGQIALQPAASSLFRSVARLTPALVQINSFVRGIDQRTPAFSSGIIDIASCDLSDVRGTIHGMQVAPSMLRNYDDYPPRMTSFNGWTFTPGAGTGAGSPLANAKQWMDEAWPTPSDQSVNAPDAGTRIRCEPGPTDYITTIASASQGTAAASAYRRADQLALSASNFIPGCTEFIVEYSFGVTDPLTGKLLWHGLERHVDTDGDGVVEASDAIAVRPYPIAPDGTNDPNTTWFPLEYRDQNGKWHTSDTTKLPRQGGPYRVPATLISDGAASALVSTSYFGYIDPTATATSDVGRPWAWPTLVRITLSLTDPENPGVEETFQFIFPTAGNPT